MGKPAARQGDSTAHGGIITAGQPTVLIGGKPAARISDMHTCPMFNGPQPHSGGPVAMGSSGVLIEGMPAARVGGTAPCSGPPDTIMMGCPTVLIGAVGSGTAGAGAGGIGVAGAEASAAMARSGSNDATTKREHWVEVEFVDSAGNPVSGVAYEFEDPDGNVEEDWLQPDGGVRRDALSEGSAAVLLKDVYEAAWDTNEARTGTEVGFSAEVDGFEKETPATVQVFQRDLQGPDTIVDEMELEVQGGAVEGTWTYEEPASSSSEEGEEGESAAEEASGGDSGGEADGGYSAPQYYVEVQIEACTARSGLLTYKDYIEIELTNKQGDPIGGVEYVVYLSDGSIRKGTLNQQGTAKETDVPPGTHEVEFQTL